VAGLQQRETNGQGVQRRGGGGRDHLTTSLPYKQNLVVSTERGRRGLQQGNRDSDLKIKQASRWTSWVPMKKPHVYCTLVITPKIIMGNTGPSFWNATTGLANIVGLKVCSLYA